MERDTMTVKELKHILEHYDDDAVISISSQSIDYSSATLTIGDDEIMRYSD